MFSETTNTIVGLPREKLDVKRFKLYGDFWMALQGLSNEIVQNKFYLLRKMFNLNAGTDIILQC